jgi:hypothetical protein
MRSEKIFSVPHLCHLRSQGLLVDEVSLGQALERKLAPVLDRRGVVDRLVQVAGGMIVGRGRAGAREDLANKVDDRVRAGAELADDLELGREVAEGVAAGHRAEGRAGEVEAGADDIAGREDVVHERGRAERGVVARCCSAAGGRRRSRAGGTRGTASARMGVATPAGTRPG